MADFLLYWKEFWKYYDESEPFTDEWETRQEPFYNSVKKGDNLWIVISGGKNSPDKWRLLQRIVVKRKVTATKNISQYGKYEIKGDRKKTLVFDFDSQKDFANILRKLNFVSGKKIKAEGRKIGNAIQKIRPLLETDSILLNDYARTLKRHKMDIGYQEDLFEDVITENFEKKFEKFVRKGAGFGNPETNKKVERSAIAAVKKDYELKGWKVKSVETNKCGYDLLCTKRSDENHVEVKGVQGNFPAFIITSAEVKKAENDNDFMICAVTSALSANPKIQSYTGQEFIKKFDRKPLAFRATLRANKGD